MTRREAIQRVAALPALAWCIVSPAKFGRISVDTHEHLATRVRVLVNGKDVTDSCTEADDINGYAIVLKRDSDWRLFVEHGEVASERVAGDVRIEWKA